jgi:hypothetical protein
MNERPVQSDDRRHAPPPAKFFCAIMSTSGQWREEAEAALTARLGPLEHRSVVYDFSAFSAYYDEEMGGRVWKYFVTFQRPAPMETLVDVKLFTEEVQRRLARPGGPPMRRAVNLDPGYLTGWNVVLATVKNQAHRFHLGQGVYAELTLLFRKRRFEPLPWTYRDYSSSAVIDFFGRVRSDYLEQLRSWNASGSSDGA